MCGTASGTSAGTWVGTCDGGWSGERKANLGTRVGTRSGTGVGTTAGTRSGTGVGTTSGTSVGTCTGVRKAKIWYHCWYQCWYLRGGERKAKISGIFFSANLYKYTCMLGETEKYFSSNTLPQKIPLISHSVSQWCRAYAHAHVYATPADFWEAPDR